MEYLLKASLVITIFYTCYKIFLQRDTFFQPNRWFLLVGLTASFTLPLVIIPVYIEFTPMPVTENLVITEPLSTPQVTETPISLWQYITISYLIGLVFFLLRFCVQLTSLFWLISKNKKYKQQGYTYVETTNDTPPFSFFRWMVYNPNQFNKEELQHIISHEKVHIKQHHTIDIILSQLNTIIFWFNPISWFYKKDLQQNLEFIADYNAQTNSNRKNYQKLLLKTSMPTHQLALTNNFYNSLIKKRIVMLQKSKSRKRNLFKHILVLPLIALFLLSFNTKEIYVPKAIETNNSSTFEANNTAPKTVIITKESTDIQLKAFRGQLVLNNITLVLSDVIRNNNNEIIKLTAKVTNAKGSGGATWANGNNPIPNIEVGENKEGNVIARTHSIKAPTKHVAEKVATNSTVKQDNQKKGNELYLIGKDFTDASLDKLTEKLNKKGVKSKFKNIKRNKKNEIIAIKIEVSSAYGSSNYGISSEKPINPIKISFKDDGKEIGIASASTLKNVRFLSKDDKHKTYKLGNNKNVLVYSYSDDDTSGQHKSVHIINGDTIKWESSGKKGNYVTIKGNHAKVVDDQNEDTADVIVKANRSLISHIDDDKKPILILDGKEVENDHIQNIAPEKIYSVHVLQGEKAIKAYGDKAKDGAVVVTTKAKKSSQVTFKLKEGALYIVDGKELDQSAFKAINPKDIDDVNTLTGENAIKKYGDKGKNDVIEITTKNLAVGSPYDSSNQTETLTISGNVSTAKGKGLPGTTIIVKGSTKGTTANLDGNYTIKVSEGDKLAFSFPGMVSKEVVVKNEKQINIVLNEGESVKEEGSNTLKSANKSTIIKATKALTTEKPLIIIDGKKVKTKTFENLDPSNIESLRILKNESAIKKYGQKGKNGVVLIETKNKK